MWYQKNGTQRRKDALELEKNLNETNYVSHLINREYARIGVLLNTTATRT